MVNKYILNFNTYYFYEHSNICIITSKTYTKKYKNFTHQRNVGLNYEKQQRKLISR